MQEPVVSPSPPAPAAAGVATRQPRQLCASPPPPLPVLHPSISLSRANALVQGANKWVNGTVLHYYFFDNAATDASEVEYSDHSRKRLSWLGSAAQQAVVRWAFQQWKDLGIGLEFQEVPHREEAEIRIGFLATDGSWSYIGTDVLQYGTSERTMNFGWDLTTPYGHGTALHEIGHTLGLPHEHQSPFAGIVWDEEAVYQEFSQAPNSWSRSMIASNILQPLNPQLVRGSQWDPDSIMEYEFGPGLIKAPAAYQQGVFPPGKLSPSDVAWVKQFYPAMSDNPPLLEVSKSVPLSLKNGGQANFRIEPTETRYYSIQTFGKSDVLLSLFEDETPPGAAPDTSPATNFLYRSADDDSGQERNALLKLKLFRGHRYVLRARLKYRETDQPPVVMMW